MRTSRPLGFLLSAALVGSTPIVLAAGPAAAATDSTLTGERQFKVGTYHDNKGPSLKDDTVGYGGKLTSGGEPVTGATVGLERKLAGQDEWKAIDDTTTDGEGIAVFTTDVAGNAKYRLVFDGDAEHAAATSPALKLKAMRDFNARTSKKHGRLHLLGDLNPGWGHHKVTLQKRTSKHGKWHNVGHDRTNGKGHWNFRVGYPPRRGQDWYFRAKIKGGGGFISSTSAVLHTYVI